MANIEFGTVQEFGEKKDSNDDPITCRVVPDNSDGAKTLELYLPIELRAQVKNIKVGELVLYAERRDGAGVILAFIPDYQNDVIEDWDRIIRNKNPLQINGDVHIKGNITIDKNAIITGNTLIEGNADILGDLANDGDAAIGKGLEIQGSNTKIGGTVKIDGTTATGSQAFGGFPGGVDPMTGLTVSQNTVMGAPLSGNKASGNKGNYEKIEDNEER